MLAAIHVGRLQEMHEELQAERQRLVTLKLTAREGMVRTAETQSELAAAELRLKESELKRIDSQEQQTSTIQVRRELQAECAALHETRVELEVERLRCFRLEADAASNMRSSRGGFGRGDFQT